MNGVFGNNSELEGHTGMGTTWANEMNFGMNRVPDARSIAQPINL